MVNSKNKGNAFERKVCVLLSEWWSDGERDDIFWRTDNSGGRATTRRKTEKKTFGQSGDVQATDPIGQPLIDLCSIELKTGYNKNTIADLLDKADDAALQQFEKWVIKAVDDCTDNAFSWLIISRRDRRKPLVFYPAALQPFLYPEDKEELNFPSAFVFAIMNGEPKLIYVCTLDAFLETCKPSNVRRALRRLKRKREQTKNENA